MDAKRVTMTYNLFDSLFIFIQALSLSMARAVGCSIFVPSWGRRHTPSLHRNAICMAISLPQAMLYWEAASHGLKLEMNFVLTGFKELLLGCMLGSLLAIPFWVIRGAYTLVDNQRGANAAQMSNPAMEADSSLLGELAERFFIVILIETGFYFLVFQALFDSYQLWPLASAWPVLTQGISHQVLLAFANLFTDTMLLSAPFLLFLLLIEFGMAIGSSSVQGIDVFQVSMPIKSIFSLLILALTMQTFLYRSLEKYEDWWISGALRALTS